MMSSAFIKDKIKFAVIGCGHIGKRHAEMIRRNPETELVALCDIKPAKDVGLENATEPFFNSIEDLFSSDIKFDVLNVCTPNGLHASHSLTALEAGKHVVCEKPMALSRKDAESVIYKSLQASKHVFLVMQNRYSPPSVWIKSVIDNKLLGDIYLVQVNCLWNRDNNYYNNEGWKGSFALDGGTLFTQFSHFVDITYWLFGDIKDIKCSFADFNHNNLTEFEDSGLITFSFINGGLGCLQYSTSVWNRNLESSMTIIGSKGSVKIGGQYMNEVEYCNIENYTMPELAPCNPANDYGKYKGSAANHHYIIENVVDTLKGRTSASTNALEGLKVVDIIERIYEQRPANLIKKLDCFNF